MVGWLDGGERGGEREDGVGRWGGRTAEMLGRGSSQSPVAISSARRRPAVGSEKVVPFAGHRIPVPSPLRPAWS